MDITGSNSTTTTTTTTKMDESDDDDDDDDDDSDESGDDLEGLEGDSWHPKPKQTLEKAVPKPTIRPDWCQSMKLITITLFVKGMTKEDVTVTCDEKEISCKFTAPTGEVFDNTWHLWGSVKPHRMNYDVSKVKVEIRVKKKVKGDWESLEEKNKESAATLSRRQNLHTTFEQQKDKRSPDYWAKLEKEQKEDEEELKPGGSDGMDQLFKQIFRKATPETQRAMMKSYQTSGGTVLSTNWDEVGKTDYEKNITPPKGMEVRHYKDEM